MRECLIPFHIALICFHPAKSPKPGVSTIPSSLKACQTRRTTQYPLCPLQATFALRSYCQGVSRRPICILSLIYCSLTRRFTLLRSYNGDPVALEDLKSKFAEQRRRGAPNQVSEVEEDMILEALGRMRFTGGASRDEANTTDDSPRASTSNTVDTDTAPSSPKPAKRFSNNLFGSARLRDYNYVRSVERGGSTRSALSFSPSELSTSTRNDGLHRPRTPEEGSPSFNISVPSSPEQYIEHDAITPTARSSRLNPFNQEAFKRASLALEDVIREIEEEAEEPGVDDDIVLLRSPSDVAHGESSHEEDEPDSVSCVFSRPYPTVIYGCPFLARRRRSQLRAYRDCALL